MISSRSALRPAGAEPSAPADSLDDDWLDTVSAEQDAPRDTRSARWFGVVHDTLSVPFGRLRLAYSFLATTPGKMLATTIVLAMAILAAGFSMSQSSAQRQQGLDELLTQTEPLNFAAHNLYTSLSLADTIATSGFVADGAESSEQLNRYYRQIDQAAVAATQSATGVDPANPRIGELVSTIQRQLPVYTGMVETARTNSRLGNPVGVTYMANASELMRGTLLPAAAELFQITSAHVSHDQKALTTPQWIPLSGLLAAVVFLILAQWGLYRATRRRLNRGFGLATIFMIVAIVWVSASNFMTWQSGSVGFQQASHPWEALTTARILAQQTQTTETFALMRRESAGDTAVSFEEMAQATHAALDAVEARPAVEPSTATTAHIERARQALEDWGEAHDAYLDTLERGDFDEGSRLVTAGSADDGVPSVARSATTLDRQLSALINDARITMRSFIAGGRDATTTVATAVFLLSLAAVLSVAFGIRARLQEYL
ncbi:membrane protein [Corynebacterium uterequi]|uniref:Chemotaxis methyl-accepting receptor HlyB-like 4HB MCP domain-containing protein n=1 Tax=Corynebacterium uterequi TaxID=1072256 RepID=A0A0G3HLB6_9CORY|nr:membrane protein [Corynebacterium uterequi]AKK11912.1 hypothetical protein CUTER_09720 [Corynebacterium uterequi]